ncbi:hypothetical protein D0269_21420 [Vibrio alginolyticus]|nr:hypothetical protein [Vibrio alginolyticus]
MSFSSNSFYFSVITALRLVFLSYFLLLTSYFLLLTSYFLLLTSYFLLLTSYCLYGVFLFKPMMRVQ